MSSFNSNFSNYKKLFHARNRVSTLTIKYFYNLYMYFISNKFEEIV